MIDQALCARYRASARNDADVEVVGDARDGDVQRLAVGHDRQGVHSFERGAVPVELLARPRNVRDCHVEGRARSSRKPQQVRDQHRQRHDAGENRDLGGVHPLEEAFGLSHRVLDGAQAIERVADLRGQRRKHNRERVAFDVRIGWAERDSGTDADLYAVAAHGTDIFVVGEGIVLHSIDHGTTWITKNEPVATILGAVAVNSTQVVAGGMHEFLDPVIMISEDRGDSWQIIDSWPDERIAFADIVSRDGLFVAAASIWPFSDGGRVFVSDDGKQWNDMFRDPDSGFRTIVDDGSRFTIAGNYGTVITSIDGLNWTETQTPLLGPDYLSGAWNGTKLVLAGGQTCVPGGVYPGDCTVQWGEIPLGISSTDGGVTWDLFNIDSGYQSFGMAFGNGRFVSVGISDLGAGEGAIYSEE